MECRSFGVKKVKSSPIVVKKSEMNLSNFSLESCLILTSPFFFINLGTCCFLAVFRGGRFPVWLKKGGKVPGD